MVYYRVPVANDRNKGLEITTGWVLMICKEGVLELFVINFLSCGFNGQN